jgi:pSer/pThr/pTyr-binding forkhead associated (FHA) protein
VSGSADSYRPYGLRCPQCGDEIGRSNARCPKCGYPVGPSTPEVSMTRPLKRSPLAIPLINENPNRFLPDAYAVLQFMPSGTCIPLDVRTPVILGRSAPAATEQLLDLTEFNAHQHGVSRQHCRLQRNGDCLTATDLDSINGTYLNGEPLLPHRDYILTHGDKLILGTLHVYVFFSTL